MNPMINAATFETFGATDTNKEDIDLLWSKIEQEE